MMTNWTRIAWQPDASDVKKTVLTGLVASSACVIMPTIFVPACYFLCPFVMALTVSRGVIVCAVLVDAVPTATLALVMVSVGWAQHVHVLIFCLGLPAAFFSFLVALPIAHARSRGRA
jgi:hypothetical protein